QSVNREAIGDDASFHNRQIPAPRRSFVDLTAQPWFKHAQDYSWLVGQLHFNRTENSWRLRYASLDENDPYEGEVTLAYCSVLHYLRDGHYVKVYGHLTDPLKKQLGSPYKVSSMASVNKGAEDLAKDGEGEARPGDS